MSDYEVKLKQWVKSKGFNSINKLTGTANTSSETEKIDIKSILSAKSSKSSILSTITNSESNNVVNLLNSKNKLSAINETTQVAEIVKKFFNGETIGNLGTITFDEIGNMANEIITDVVKDTSDVVKDTFEVGETVADLAIDTAKIGKEMYEECKDFFDKKDEETKEENVDNLDPPEVKDPPEVILSSGKVLKHSSEEYDEWKQKQNVKKEAEEVEKSKKEIEVDEARSSVMISQSNDLYEIGKPSKFNDNIDQFGRYGNYIKSKMNVLDLIPCDYSINIIKAGTVGDVIRGGINSLKYHISYTSAIANFKRICANYGIKSKPAGIRIFTTDDTTSSDELKNSFSQSILESAIEGVSSKFKRMETIRHFGQSVSSVADEILAAGTKSLVGMSSTGLGLLAGFYSESAGETVKQFSEGLMSSVADVIVNGHTLSLPKTWNDSSYSPNLSCVIKLVSPYGSPKAIKQFIIEPLLVLSLMAMPRTNDGISFGYPPLISVKAHGLASFPAAAISSITFRRGGNDTSFNIYRQPLSIDVSIDFVNLVEGCAAFNNEGSFLERNCLKNADEFKSGKPDSLVSDGCLFQTPGKLVESLRPIALQEVTANNLGLDGNFSYTVENFSNVVEGEGGTTSGGFFKRIVSEAKGAYNEIIDSTVSAANSVKASATESLSNISEKFKSLTEDDSTTEEESASEVIHSSFADEEVEV